MNLQQAYINGFFKQAAAYGFSEKEVVELYQKHASELKGDQHKLDVNKNGKIDSEDLKKLRQRKQAADGAPLTAPGTPDTNIMNSLKGLFSRGSGSMAPAAQATVPAAPAATLNDRILKAVGMPTLGIPPAEKGAYGGVLGNSEATIESTPPESRVKSIPPIKSTSQAGGAKAVPAPR